MIIGGSILAAFALVECARGLFSTAMLKEAHDVMVNLLVIVAAASKSSIADNQR